MTSPQEKITDLGRRLFDAKERKDRLETELKEVNEEIKKIAEDELAKIMTDSEIDKISIKGLGTVYMSDSVYASVLKEDRDRLHVWMRENGFGSIISEYIFPQTLTAFAKEMMTKNETLPEILRVTTIPTAKTRKSS